MPRAAEPREQEFIITLALSSAAPHSGSIGRDRGAQGISGRARSSGNFSRSAPCLHRDRRGGLRPPRVKGGPPGHDRRVALQRDSGSGHHPKSRGGLKKRTITGASIAPVINSVLALTAPQFAVFAGAADVARPHLHAHATAFAFRNGDGVDEQVCAI